MGSMQMMRGLSLALVAALLVTAVRGQVQDPQLLGSTMVIRGLKMYAFGGMTTNSTTPQNTLWQFDMTSRLWTVMAPASSDKPPGRTFHQATMSSDSRYMIIYGGIACFERIQMVTLEKGLKEYHMQQDTLEYASVLEDVWMFDFVTKMWMEVSPQQYTRSATCPTAEGVKKLESAANRQASISLLFTAAFLVISIAVSSSQ